MTLREILHAHIPTLFPESTVRDAVDKMDIYQFPALVIVDNEMRPTGIISEGDIARAIGQNGNLAQLMTQPALEFASREPVTAHPGEEISDALHRMLASGLTLLPITEHDRLSGVVLRVDLMHALFLDLAAPLLDPELEG